MENHPIPQDVTGFKFKLIGSVTVKQFLYILGGGISAIVCYVLPISGLIKFPLAALFGGMGVAVAFIPIDGRPMDVMLKNFLKALPSENQYIFKKRGAEALITEFFTQSTTVIKEQVKTPENDSLDSKRALLYKTLKQTYRPDKKEEERLTDINSYLHESLHSASPPVQNVDAPPKEMSTPLQVVTPSVTIATKEVKAVPLPTASDPVSVESNANLTATPAPVAAPVQAAPAEAIQTVTPTTSTANPLTQIVTPPPTPVEAVPPVATPPAQSPQPQIIISVAPTSNSLESTPLPVRTQKTNVDKVVTPNESSNVTTVTPEASLQAGFPQLPDIPNVVLGIVKDPRGKVIPNILVEIMNTQNVPVRAFKTNALGQFAAATPLPSGEYTVLMEDPRRQNEFEQFQISLDGTIFNPLEIISLDQREKLRRELFGNAPQAAT